MKIYREIFMEDFTSIPLITQITLFGCGICVLLYCFYQFIRNYATYRIIGRWIESHDKRYDRFTYEYIFTPNTHNWYGLKFPREKDYENIC